MYVRNDVQYTIFLNALDHRLVIFSFTFNCTQQLVPKCECGKLSGWKLERLKSGRIWSVFFFFPQREYLYLRDSNNGLISLKSLKENNKPGLKMLKELSVCILSL